MVRQTTSAWVAMFVNKRAPQGANDPPGAFNARRSASSITSCKVTTVGNLRAALMGVNKPDRLDKGDLPKILAPKLNQIKSGFNRFRRDKMVCRAFNPSGCQQ